MILTWTLPAIQERETLDALNRESADIYNRVLTRHWRFYRKHGVWMSQAKAERVDDALSSTTSLLHSHSIDAAQQAFYKAIHTARPLRKQDKDVRFPFKRKRFRPTVFKSTQLKREGDHLRLALANKPYLRVPLPPPCRAGRRLFQRGSPCLQPAVLLVPLAPCRRRWPRGSPAFGGRCDGRGPRRNSPRRVCHPRRSHPCQLSRTAFHGSTPKQRSCRTTVFDVFVQKRVGEMAHLEESEHPTKSPVGRQGPRP